MRAATILTLAATLAATSASARDITIEDASGIRLLPHGVTQLVTGDARGRRLVSVVTRMTKVVRDVPEGGSDRVELIEVRRDERPFVDAAVAYVHVRHVEDVTVMDAVHQYRWSYSARTRTCLDGLTVVPDFACP